MVGYYAQTFYPSITKNDNSQNSTQWLESELHKQGIRFAKQSDGVYFCTVNTAFVAVILPDHCSSPVFLQTEFPNALPFLLIAEQPVCYNTPGSTIAHISEFISGAKVLTKEIEKCILQFKDAKPASPFVCVVPALPTNNDKLILSRSDDAIYINDTKMINKHTAQFDILNVLIDTALNDCIKRTTTYLNASRIAQY
jgi:hypothetical protein